MHARTWLISTSGLKLNVTIVILVTDVLQDAGIPAIREHVRQKLAYLRLHGFSGSFGPKWRFWGQNRGTGGVTLTPQRTRSYFWRLLPLCHSDFRRKSIKKCDRESAEKDRHTL